MLRELNCRMWKGWLGVDLDGTIAHYDGWKGIQHIGEPIEPLVSIVRNWIKRGEDVRIFTARVSQDDPQDNAIARCHIEQWCLLHLGKVLPITNVKDFGMTFCFDDRAIRILKNIGVTCCNTPWGIE